MKKTLRSIISCTIVLGSLFSMTSCGLFDKAKKQCTEVGNEFVEAAISMDFEDCVELCIDEDEAVGLLAFSDKQITEAILENATYKADSKSADCSTKDEEGSIDYIVTVPDFEAALDEDPEDFDEFCDILEEVEGTIDITFTIEFELDDDEWFVSNPDDICNDFLMEVTDIGADFSNYDELVDEFQWWLESSYGLELDLISLDTNYVWEFYFTVSHGGELIYTSEELTDTGYYIEAYFYPEDIGVSEFEPGEYTIAFYDVSGGLIGSNSTTLD